MSFMEPSQGTVSKVYGQVSPSNFFQAFYCYFVADEICMRNVVDNVVLTEFGIISLKTHVRRIFFQYAFESSHIEPQIINPGCRGSYYIIGSENAAKCSVKRTST